MKPREFWIKLFNEKNVLPQNRAASAWDKEQMEYNAQYHDCSKQHFYEEHVHVIEKSAYDRLEAMCEKLGAAAVKLGLVKDLYNPDYVPSVRDLIDAEDEFRKVLAEYRAMKGEK